MSAPILWIFIPAIAAVVLFLLRSWYRITVLAGTILSLIFGGLAWVLSIGKVINLGFWSFQVGETLSLLGRRMVLTDADRPMLILVYLLAAFWFGAAYVAMAGRLLVPLGLGIVAVLVAALAVEPFLYAGLLIELAALLSVPIMSTPGKPIQRGVLRFITFQTLGVPFFLFSGWMLEGIETSPGNLDMAMRAGGLLMFGFFFLLAVFPFHTWVPMLAGQVRPYAAGFILVMMPWMVILFGMRLLDQYAWLRANPALPLLVQRVGLVMSVAAGISVAFERQLGRILGFSVLAETGFTLLALGLPGGAELSTVMMLPRVLALGMWSLALTLLQDQFGDLRFHTLQGAARQKPLVCAALVLAQFSMAGFPLLADFPVRLALWEAAAAQSIWTGFWALIATAGLFTSASRTLAVLVMGEEETSWKFSENWSVNMILGAGIVATILVGVFPQIILPAMVNVLKSYPHLVP